MWVLRSSKKLEDTHRIVAETEEVGIAVLDTLSQQRESLLGAHEKVRSRLCRVEDPLKFSPPLLTVISLRRSARRVR
jgi:vesicle transport through interaction with t-SNAREs protein 1